MPFPTYLGASSGLVARSSRTCSSHKLLRGYLNVSCSVINVQGPRPASTREAWNPPRCTEGGCSMFNSNAWYAYAVQQRRFKCSTAICCGSTKILPIHVEVSTYHRVHTTMPPAKYSRSRSRQHSFLPSLTHPLEASWQVWIRRTLESQVVDATQTVILFGSSSTRPLLQCPSPNEVSLHPQHRKILPWRPISLEGRTSRAGRCVSSPTPTTYTLPSVTQRNRRGIKYTCGGGCFSRRALCALGTTDGLH